MKEIREKIKNFLEFNENESITYHNLWDTTNTVLKGMFIPMSTHINNTERSQIK
jgi:hypothetical protein